MARSQIKERITLRALEVPGFRSSVSSPFRPLALLA